MRQTCLVAVCGLLLAAGCKKDPNTPEYWDTALTDAHHPSDKVRILDSLANSQSFGPLMAPMLETHLASEKSPLTKASIARLLGQLRDSSALGPLSSAIDLQHASIETHEPEPRNRRRPGQPWECAGTPTLLVTLAQESGQLHPRGRH